MTKDEMLDRIEELKKEANELTEEIEMAQYNARNFPYPRVKDQTLKTIKECTKELSKINKEFKKLFADLNEGE